MRESFMFMQSEQCNKQLEMLLQLHLQRVFTRLQANGRCGIMIGGV